MSSPALAVVALRLHVPNLSGTTRRFSLAVGTLRRSAVEASPEAGDRTDVSLAGTPVGAAPPRRSWWQGLVALGSAGGVAAHHPTTRMTYASFQAAAEMGARGWTRTGLQDSPIW